MGQNAEDSHVARQRVNLLLNLFHRFERAGRFKISLETCHIHFELFDLAKNARE